ncbi:arabinofuranan 3-O-arabinosyltransferase [Sinosporangium album]|uniref:Arabinofuranan 3-O-arabinosyltransferase n=1 Tax=Sinosporangium album TaxID=504805 RepID=A0A1G7VTW2_9ACTN|nr:arabinofuranan 3-O-arabinosyltransferase [Sinosporangium album]
MLKRPPAAPAPDGLLLHRLRLVLCCAALAALALLTHPGHLLNDTKLDLATAPAAFLGRALDLWDVNQFGQLQNQVAGYLFPMGPFFLLGDLAGLEGWVVQRLWGALLLVTAFLGAERLARALRIGTPATRIAAGLAYALAPRALALVGVLSSEFAPAAMLPWIVLPLVLASRGAGRVVCAARSAFAVALCGGINAAATAAVLLPPAIYLLTRSRAVPRGRLFAWWAAFTALATLWWTVPLVLFARYGFSFLEYTESAAAITPTTSLTNTLRGSADWVAWLSGATGPAQPVGHALATTPVYALATGVVAALGLTGLLLRGLPERRFLTLTALAGVLVLLAGHISVLEPPVAGLVRDLLDGPLAPLRNLRKFDPAIRLPLALGLAHLLTAVRLPRARAAASALAACSLGVTALPAATLGLAGTGVFREVPPYWQEAARWLNARTADHMVLSVPGSRFGEYTWGRPLDEPLQHLSTVRWAQRQVAAAGSVGLVRLLDAIDARLTEGRGSPGLSTVLSRMGVRYLLVRNDLDRGELAGAWPARIHQALADSPGVSKVAEFGPPVGGSWALDDATAGLDPLYPALTVFEVEGADEPVRLTAQSDLLRVFGGPEALLDLADHGLLDGEPVVLNDDIAAGASPGRRVVTDSLRKRQRQFGELRRSVSPTLTAAERPPRPGAVDDFMEEEWLPFRTVAEYRGIKGVTASSSAADPGAIPALHGMGYLPYAAFDGDLRTAWRSGGWNGGVGQWLQVDFVRRVDPGGVTAVFVPDPALGPAPVRVSVETEAGAVEQDIAVGTQPQSLRTPQGRTEWLRIRVVDVAFDPLITFGTGVAISELAIAGVPAVRTYAPPDVADRGPATHLFTRASGDRRGCMRGPVRWLCQESLAAAGEEGYGFDRSFTSLNARKTRISGFATLRDPDLVERYTRVAEFPKVEGSGAGVPEPVAGPGAAFDGDAATTWITGAGDAQPVLSLRWNKAKVIDRLTVDRPPGASSSATVFITGGRGQVRGGVVAADGTVTFKPMRTDRLRLRFTPFETPMQITEVTVPGVKPLPDVSAMPFHLECGLGPSLSVNGALVRTEVEGTFGDVLNGRPLRYSTCERVSLRAGDNRLSVAPLDPFRVDSALTGGAPARAEARPGTADVVAFSPSSRTVSVNSPKASYLTVTENFNAGWTATINGRELTPLRLDGWRQAWAVPAGTEGVVQLTYTPTAVFRIVTAVGFAALVPVVFFALFPPARRLAPPGEMVSRGTPGRIAVIALGAGAGFWVAGFAGAVVVPALTLALRLPLMRRWGPVVPGVFLLLSCALLAFGLAAGGAGPLLGDALPAVLALPAVAGLLAGAVREPESTPPLPPPLPPPPSAEAAEGLLDPVEAPGGHSG